MVLPAMGVEPTSESKRQLRERHKRARLALSDEKRTEASMRIVDALWGIEALRAASAVALFWPMVKQAEPDLRPLDAMLRERRVPVLYPVVVGTGEPLVFRRLDQVDALERHPLGFWQPEASQVVNQDFDALVVPGLAFDRSGGRLGYGGGYYDTTLRAMTTRPLVIGVAYECQMVARVPMTSHDESMDAVVTERGVHWVAPK
jgi:5-formyltetrahydrofolate cyclo-ligase